MGKDEQFRQAFFTELDNLLADLILIWPEEVVDFTSYKSIIRTTTNLADRKWALDTFLSFALPYKDKILAKDVSFFKDNADELAKEHVQRALYKDEATQWISKIQDGILNGKFSPDDESQVMNYIERLLRLSMAEQKFRGGGK